MKRHMRITLCAGTMAALLAADSWITLKLAPRERVRAASAGIDAETAADPLAQFRLEREQLRARQQAELNDIIHSEGIDPETAAQARRQLLEMLDCARQEATLEGLLRGRGFEEALVSVSGQSANVLVPGETLTQRETAVILELVMRETGLTGGNVKIIPVK